MGRTLFEKIWAEHVVADLGGGANLLYVDRHYLHELCVSRGFPTMHERGLRSRDQADRACVASGGRGIDERRVADPELVCEVAARSE